MPLFYTLAIIFLQRPALADIGRISVYVVAAGGPVWVLSYATMATMTAVAIRCEPECGDRPPLAVPVVVGLILIAVLLVASYAAIRVPRLRPARLRAEVGTMLPAVVVLLTTFGAGGASLAFPLLGDRYRPSDGLLTLLLSVNFIVLLLFSRSASNVLRELQANDPRPSSITRSGCRGRVRIPGGGR
ncbi:hypothetical protein ACQP2Y_37455 [Actinoplanes sp. CA-051413]|uniref:hypothetical protein n=1 Tax=Actinoplanes sp. CA-051413 TaxID=3239899 RepID=UPI003D9923FB